MLFSTGSDYSVMNKSLDALWLKLKVVSDNIANNDTPGYTAKAVSFEDILQKKIRSSDSTKTLKNKIESTNPLIVDDNSGTVRADGNNVDIEAQNIEFARTQIQYEYMLRMMSGAISRQKYAITEGKR